MGQGQLRGVAAQLLNAAVGQSDITRAHMLGDVPAQVNRRVGGNYGTVAGGGKTSPGRITAHGSRRADGVDG